MSNWNEMYLNTPPWDTGQPQPAIVEIIRNCTIMPRRILDVGCGTGSNAIFFAKNGFSVEGIDTSLRALRLAQKNATEKNIKVHFRVGNALELQLQFDRGEFDAVIDSGLFHTFTDTERVLYVKQVARVLRTGGAYIMLCFSEKERSKGGPRRVTKNEIKQTLMTQFRIHYIRETRFSTRIHKNGAHAYITYATKIPKSPYDAM